MHIFIITGASCVGKSSAAKTLLKHVKIKAAYLDCDWVACYVPFDFINRPALMEANICACVPNYAKAGVECMIITWAHIDQVPDFTNQLFQMGYDVQVISLVADKISLMRRYEKSGGSNQDSYLQVIYKLDEQSRKLNCDFRLDMSEMSIDDVAEQIAEKIQRIIEGNNA